MIITVSGKPGSGKSTIAKLVAKKLGYKYYSVGELMRQIAEEKGITLLELGKIAEKERWVDEKLDEIQIKLDKEDNFVIDSRLGYYFLPKSFKVFLEVTLEEGARRIHKDKMRKQEQNRTLKQSMENIKERTNSEKKRYRKYYKLNPYNKKNYDLVIDTTNITAEQVADKVIKKIGTEQ